MGAKTARFAAACSHAAWFLACSAKKSTPFQRVPVTRSATPLSEEKRWPSWRKPSANARTSISWPRSAACVAIPFPLKGIVAKKRINPEESYLYRSYRSGSRSSLTPSSSCGFEDPWQRRTKVFGSRTAHRGVPPDARTCAYLSLASSPRRGICRAPQSLRISDFRQPTLERCSGLAAAARFPTRLVRPDVCESISCIGSLRPRL